MRCATASACAPSKVVQNAYEPIHYDERGQLCGAQPTLGMDVHPKLRLSRERLPTTARSSASSSAPRMHLDAQGRNCPANLATGAAPASRSSPSTRRSLRARHLRPRSRATESWTASPWRMPRKSAATQEFKPYTRPYTLPYGPRWRLFRTPNDAFLTANTHREGCSLFDILQPAYAGLYSGAVHPTAEGHALRRLPRSPCRAGRSPRRRRP
jgi:hypothetical protein